MGFIIKLIPIETSTMVSMTMEFLMDKEFISFLPKMISSHTISTLVGSRMVNLMDLVSCVKL